MVASDSDFTPDQVDGSSTNTTTTPTTETPVDIEVVDDDFEDIAKHKVIEVSGSDILGRPVIAFYSCQLPPSNTIDHSRLLRYLKFTLDKYVENDYTLIYFHHGLSRSNKPSLGWLRQAYREFDRKYKKNLKAMYLVHPTNFIKILWGIFKPIISVKFGRKVQYVNYLKQLESVINVEHLVIPDVIKEHDRKVMAKYQSKIQKNTVAPAQQKVPSPTQQFGVPLQFLKEHSKGTVIPKVMKETITFLQEKGLEVEGIFRRCPNAAVVRDVQSRYNKGESVDYSALLDVHIPAAILKTFLRELPEPLLTYQTYDRIITIKALELSNQVKFCQSIVNQNLSDDTYTVLKYLFDFLQQVLDHSDVNKMNSVNLAIIFGPNLVWSTNHALSLAAMDQINTFTKLLLDHHDEVFTKEIPTTESPQ
ncbi:rho GTPase-activating protein 1-like [Glandiceps talaboti]